MSHDVSNDDSITFCLMAYQMMIPSCTLCLMTYQMMIPCTLCLITRRYFSKNGGIIEAFLECADACAGESPNSAMVQSPSVQCRITPDGKPAVISTHDQLLDGQSFSGCIFPAQGGYRREIIRQAMAVCEVRSALASDSHCGCAWRFCDALSNVTHSDICGGCLQSVRTLVVKTESIVLTIRRGCFGDYRE
jgi:hypothetical protein